MKRETVQFECEGLLERAVDLNKVATDFVDGPINRARVIRALNALITDAQELRAAIKLDEERDIRERKERAHKRMTDQP